ncbi:autophagocytosis associated protein, partial [Mycena belliarum]
RRHSDLDGPADDALGRASARSPSARTLLAETPDLDDIPDMEEDGLEEGEGRGDGRAQSHARAYRSPTANLLQVRTYDVMITYDKYYQTPRIWLIVYDENRTPLTPPQIFQDISADHALKTVTIEAFPHSASLQAASVHPCKHASVMKKVIERMNTSVVEEQLAQRKSAVREGQEEVVWAQGQRHWKDDKGKEDKGEEEEVEGMRVDFYLVVFLKFIASIVPTIEVDSTASF